MKTIWRALLAASLLANATLAVADSHNNTFQLTIVNNTQQTLTFTGVTRPNPGNIFTLQSSSPETLVIEGVSMEEVDLAADLHFSDSLGHDHVMVLVDPRNKHIWQPLMSMRNSHLQSAVVSKTRGDNSDPNGLYLSGAVVRIDAVTRQ